jgi:hypothetical protein
VPKRKKERKKERKKKKKKKKKESIGALLVEYGTIANIDPPPLKFFL